MINIYDNGGGVGGGGGSNDNGNKTRQVQQRIKLLLLMCFGYLALLLIGDRSSRNPNRLFVHAKETCISFPHLMFFFFSNFQDEAFALWEHQWGRIYPEKSTAREIIHTIHDTYYLINLVDNDYVAGNKLFDILDIVLKKLGKL